MDTNDLACEFSSRIPAEQDGLFLSNFNYILICCQTLRSCFFQIFKFNVSTKKHLHIFIGHNDACYCQS